ncbi:MAG: divalent-cation tolerance protein CutA [Actinomycetota bacterium]
MPLEYLEVKTTTDSKDEAQTLAEAIVAARLAACVQVLGPIQSTYWWNGSIEKTAEWICIMKATSERFEALERFIREKHSYDTPEIIATPIAAGSAEYLEWIEKESGG